MSMRATPNLLCFGFAAMLLHFTGVAGAQTNRCADCHFANPETEPAGRHLDDWDLSSHGRSGVGCESCHGGDPSTFESFLAHRGILNSRNPASPTNERNLPRTCGRCHSDHYAAFRSTKHYDLRRGGGRTAPGCASCHGEVAAYLLSPKGLARKCDSCHGPDEKHPLPEVSAQARLLLEEVREVRSLLEQADRLIERVNDEERRERLTVLFAVARTFLREAGHVGHTFDFRGIEESTEQARLAAEVLLQALANPP